MPDIQMFGISRVRAAAVEAVFDTAPYKDALTFIHGSESVWGADYSKPQRFVRISPTREFKGLGDIIERLRPLNIDIEIMYLDEFIPAGG